MLDSPDLQSLISPNLIIYVGKLDSRGMSLDQFISQRLEQTHLKVIVRDRISLPFGDTPTERVVCEGSIQQRDLKKMEERRKGV